VPWALGFGVIAVRMPDAWSPWVLTLVLAAGAALPLALGLLATVDPGPPVAALLLAGLALALLAIARLTDALGAGGAFGSAGAAFGGLAAFAVLAGLARRRSGVPILTLVTALGAGAAALAFVQWAFSPDTPTAFRWVLLLLAVVYLGAHAQVREHSHRDGVLLLDASGAAMLALALSLEAPPLGLLFAHADFGGTWWHLVILLGGFGLCAFSAVEREPGPGFLGVAVLGLFVLSLGGAGLLWWPLILILGGGLAIGMGLRPARPLPPEPTPPGGPAETVPLPER
jgi:hypothetical protein